jgi:hypothetical protein
VLLLLLLPLVVCLYFRSALLSMKVAVVQAGLLQPLIMDAESLVDVDVALSVARVLAELSYAKENTAALVLSHLPLPFRGWYYGWLDVCPNCRIPIGPPFCLVGSWCTRPPCADATSEPKCGRRTYAGKHRRLLRENVLNERHPMFSPSHLDTLFTSLRVLALWLNYQQAPPLAVWLFPLVPLAS